MLQDSSRSGKRTWTLDLLQRGVAAGIALSPFATPKVAAPRRPSARDVVDSVYDEGGEVLFDPATHAVALPTTNKWEIYDGWDLWSGPRGDLSTADLRNDHVLRVLDAQAELGVSPIAPTLSLGTSTGLDAERSLYLAAAARSQGSDVGLSIVGTAAFWSQGRPLDDYVGQIAQLRPARVYLSVMRVDLGYPPQALAAEIEGVCRSVHSLSRRSEVVVQFADLLGLPALAAGASAIGTGWDLRQRILAPDAFRLTTTIRRTANRITYGGLLGVLKRVEAERLVRADRALSVRLVPGVLPGNGNPLWEHHLEVVAAEIAAVTGPADRQAASAALSTRYAAVRADFARVEGLARPLEAGAADWLAALALGLTNYMTGEGW